MLRQAPSDRRHAPRSGGLRFLGLVLMAAPAIWASYGLGRDTSGRAVEILSWLPLERMTAARDSILGWAQILRANEAVDRLLAGAADVLRDWPRLTEAVQTIPLWIVVWLTGLLLFVLPGLRYRLRQRRTAEIPATYSGGSALAAHNIDDGRHAAMPIDSRPPNDSARGAVFAGWLALVIFFGGFGTWAITAPLNGAVIGEAVVKVEGNRKSIQHLDGGIVSQLNVKEGDQVGAGDVLIVLDDSQARADLDVLSQQLLLLRATEARLLAEFGGTPSIDFPDELVERQEPYSLLAMEGQRKEFYSRRQAIEGSELVLNQRTAQLNEQILGHGARLHALREQLASIRDERESLEGLLKKGLIAKPRVLQLERDASRLEGEIAGTVSAIAGIEQALEEVSQQIAQLRRDQQEEITAALRDVQSRIVDVEPRLRNATNALRRNEIRSPYSGRVVDLSVFSLGAVIGAGERIMDIVPDQTGLVVDAQIRVEDIADVAPGMMSEVHFTSYKQRLTPLIHGRVIEVSADRLTDERSGKSFYNVLVEVDEAELAASPEIQLYPGMPATVMITTEERTAFDYLVGPLTASLNTSFRQK
jgi:epimerase transport system membrane fusion protein